ncbi:MAG: hypothetical protein AAF387_11135 [Pseudomonadota bacterium]
MKAKPAILLLAIIFVGPIVVSWLMVNSDIDWAERGLSNHGVLIRPPINLSNESSATTLFEYAELAPGHWAIISLENDICREACRERVDKLSLIRSVIGSAQDRLHAFALAPENPSEQTGILVDQQAATTLGALLTRGQTNVSLPQFIVVDWRQQLMLRFPPDTPPDDIKDDLAKLLRASKIR